MNKNKYYYNGIPLSDYCKKHDINIDTIRTRIWKKKNNPKYKDLTEEEIIDMVIKAYGTSVKYFYNGISLRQYCNENGIIFGTILSRIRALKKENPTLTDEELVKKSLEDFNNNNYRLYYKDMPLKDYCAIHPELNYNTIRTYINRELAKNKDLSIEDAINNYINKEHYGKNKYYYLGIPLTKYAIDNNLNYKNIISYIHRHKNDPEFLNLSDDEFISLVMDKYEPFNPKYNYNGTSLRDYCKNNDISYYSVISFVKRRLQKNKNLDVDNLIDEGIKTIKKQGIIYYYKGVPLKDYAKENNLNASSIRCHILRLRERLDLPLQEIVDLCVESYKEFEVKYEYDGMSLLSYCKENDINYNTIIHKYLDEYSNSDVDTSKKIKQIVDEYKLNPKKRTKYYINNQSLSSFCKKNSYSYISIFRRIKYLRKNTDMNEDEIINEAIKKYEERLKINKINEVFNYINTNEEIDLIKVCDTLKIDYFTIVDLLDMDFSTKQSINLIWFFSDSEIDGMKTISDKKLKKIFKYVEKLKKLNQKEIKEEDLYYLIGIYKSELYNTKNLILIKEEQNLKSIIRSICNVYNINLNENNYKDFICELEFFLIKLLNKTSLNNLGQIISYFNISLKGYFKTYIKKYNEENIASLEVNLENIMSLNPDDALFLILKYEEDYTDEELSLYFNLTLDEIKEKDNELLKTFTKKEIKVLKQTLS